MNTETLLKLCTDEELIQEIQRRKTQYTDYKAKLLDCMQVEFRMCLSGWEGISFQYRIPKKDIIYYQHLGALEADICQALTNHIKKGFGSLEEARKLGELND